MVRARRTRDIRVEPMFENSNQRIRWLPVRESKIRLYVAGRRVNVLLASSGCAPHCTRRPAPGACCLGFHARRIVHGRLRIGGSGNKVQFSGLDSVCPCARFNVAGYETEKYHPATLPQPGRPPVRQRQIDPPAQRPARACRRHRQRPRQRL